MNQKQAVYQAVCQVTNKTHNGEQAVKLSADQKDKIVTILVEGFKAGSIPLTSAKDEKSLRKYVVGLIDNWVRKDQRLNGAVQYQVKNPGSRTGSKDDMVKELRKLLKTELTSEVRAKVEAKIKERLAEIKPAKTITIDKDALPADIAELL